MPVNLNRFRVIGKQGVYTIRKEAVCFNGGKNLKGVFLMATRDSMETLIQQCEDAIRYAQEQYEESNVQQHYNNDGYTGALQSLEQTYQDVCKMAHSANSQQRDQLHRMRLQLQDLQNKMILQGP